MKTASILCAWMFLGLAAGCGGSPTAEQELLRAPPAADASAASASEADCTPVDACDPDEPLFCAAGDVCYLLYPNQRTVPVSCTARPASPRGSTTRCP